MLVKLVSLIFPRITVASCTYFAKTLQKPVRPKRQILSVGFALGRPPPSKSRPQHRPLQRLLIIVIRRRIIIALIIIVVEVAGVIIYAQSPKPNFSK